MLVGMRERHTDEGELWWDRMEGTSSNAYTEPPLRSASTPSHRKSIFIYLSLSTVSRTDHVDPPLPPEIANTLEPLPESASCWCTVSRRKRSTRSRLLAVAGMSVLLTSVAHASPIKGKGRELSTYDEESILQYQSTADRGTLLYPREQSTTHRLDRRAGYLTEQDVARHYEYVDGQWVKSSDWTLYGREGQQGTVEETNASSDVHSSTDDGTEKAFDNGRNADDSSPAEDDSDVNGDGDDTSTQTLGWARTSNAVLGVGINTAAAGTSTLATTTTATATRTSSLSSSSPTSSTIGSSGNTSGVQANSADSPVYDFSKDVPSGWISDGRTAAYAVPLIVGLSIVLAVLIFGLMFCLVRSTGKKRRRRKYGEKLSEEGKMPRTDTMSSNNSSLRGIEPRQTKKKEDAEQDEKAGLAGKRRGRISRRWSPALLSSAGGASLRKRKNIAKLFNRRSRGEEGEEEHMVVDHDEQVDTQHVQTSLTANDSAGGADLSRATTQNASTRSRSSSHSSRSSAIAPPAGPPEATESSSPHPPSLSVPPTTTSTQHINDSLSFPVTFLGPPAYIHPPSPAYARTTHADSTPSEPSSSQHQVYNGDAKASLSSNERMASVAGSSSDPYREQRRYEHLYISRDGSSAEAEQRTGAPSGSSSLARREVLEDLERREAERAEQERSGLAAHIAVDDKALLTRLREAGSAPESASQDIHMSSSSAPFGGPIVAEASAPVFDDETDDEEVDEALRQSTRASAPPLPSSASALPLPPQPFRATYATLPSASPQMDEKARLRMHQEQLEREQEVAVLPSAPPSAPSMPSFVASEGASAPPLLDAPSAPSQDDEAEPSAPPLLPDEGDEAEEDLAVLPEVHFTRSGTPQL